MPRSGLLVCVRAMYYSAIHMINRRILRTTTLVIALVVYVVASAGLHVFYRWLITPTSSIPKCF